MAFKVFAAVVAVVLMLAFLAPVVIKLKDVALGVVVVIGIGLMALDLWESFREKED